MSAEHTPTRLRELCGKLEDRSVLHDLVGIAQVRTLLEPAVDESEARESELKRRVEEMADALELADRALDLRRQLEARPVSDHATLDPWTVTQAENAARQALAKAKEATS